VKPKLRAKKEKPAKAAPAGGSPGEPKPDAPQRGTAGANWVRVTVEDVLQTLSPELRKAVEHWSKALSCPDSETARLTPEQKEWRERYVAERWSLYHAMEEKLRKEGDEARYAQAVNALHEFDQQAAWFAKNTPHPFKVSYSSRISSLAGVACRYLQRLALHGNQRAVADLARLTVEMTETLTDLLAGEPEKVEANARLMRRLTARLPYWPMIQFRHAAANNHFPRLADLLELGKDCLINATEQANYSLQTPINRFVWHCLKHFDEVHWIIRESLDPKGKDQTWSEIVAAGERAMHMFELVAAGKVNINPEKRPDDPIEKALEPYVFTDTDKHRFGMIHREEIPIYKDSFKLEPLTKSNAPQWADSAIMPYVRNRFPDLRTVEELHYLKGKVGRTGKRYAPVRKAVIQALQQLARKP
jgi:hypothetical protein